MEKHRTKLGWKVPYESFQSSSEKEQREFLEWSVWNSNEIERFAEKAGQRVETTTLKEGQRLARIYEEINPLRNNTRMKTI